MSALIPLAVVPSVRSPGMHLLVQLLSGPSSPGTGGLRCLLIAPMATGGTITPNTEVKQAAAGAADVATWLLAGTPGHLAAKRAFEEYPLLQLDVVAPAEASGVAATGTTTFASGPPTKDWTVTQKICGRTVQVQWVAGETDTQGAAKLVAAVNALTNDLPVTASNVAGVVTFTAKLKGTWGNDVLTSVTQADGTTGTVTASGAALASGTTEFDCTTALTTVAGTEYDFFLLCTGNTDAKLASATSNPGRLKTHIDGLDSGASAKLQQVIVGTTGTLSTTKTGTNQHNFGPMEYLHVEAGQSLPCEFAGAEFGQRVRERLRDPAANRIGLPYIATLYGAADLNADRLTDSENEDALQHGVTPGKYDSSNTLFPYRPITTYFKDGSGNPDDRLLDTSRVDGIYDVSKDLRSALPQEFPQAKLSRDLVPGDDPLPEGIVEERDVKSFVNTRIRYWITRGVVQKAKYEAALAGGTFIVRVDPGDDSQCDLVLPLSIVRPLAKFSLVVQHQN